jgi:hypothetical protein
MCFEIRSKLAFFCVVLMFIAAKATSAGGDTPKAGVCEAPEYHQFDFWVGDWDAFDQDNPTAAVARNHVDKILDGCVLREDYLDTSGHHGQSFSIYDRSRKVWHQTWVTNRGELLVIEGKSQNDAMILSGMDHRKNELAKGTWMAIDGGVREIGVTSADNGKTWKPWFDLIFRPHKP